MLHERLDEILDVAPDATFAATSPAPDLPADDAGPDAVISAELVPDGENTTLAPASPALPAIPDEQMAELQTDMEYARTNMKDVIDQAKSALTSALDMAEQGGEPRGYEVASQMITSIIQANKELIALHKVRKDTLKTGGRKWLNPKLLGITGIPISRCRAKKSNSQPKNWSSTRSACVTLSTSSHSM
jgi:hypothetical protein